MYYVLFRYKEGGRDYREFQNKDQVFDFLVDNIKTIFVYKIIESLAELKFGLTTIKLGVAAAPGKTKEEEIEEFKSPEEELKEEVTEPEELTQEEIDAEIVRKNKEALADLEAEEEPAAPEEEEAYDLPPTEEEEGEKVQEVLDKADKAIKNVEEILNRKCSVCGVKTTLARNKTGICTPCQLKPKKGKKKPGTRKPKF